MNGRRILRRHAGILGILAGALLLLLGSIASAADTPAKSAQLDTVRVAYNPGTVLRLYAAFERDSFRKHGLNIELIRFESGAAASAAFAAGSVDVGFTGIPGFVSSRLAGANTRVFMVENDSGAAEGLVARGDSGINTVGDLGGKRVGTVVGTTSWMGLMSALQKAGVDAATVKIQNVPPSAWAPAFQRGDIDALFIWSPALFTVAESGGKLITTMSEYRKDPLLWQARSDFLGSKADVARRFVLALEDGRPTIESRDPAFIARMAKETASAASATQKTVEAIKLIPLRDQVSDTSPYSLTSPSGLKAEIDAWVKFYLERSIFRQQPDLQNALDATAIRAAIAR
jgi:ABC-type nitrate/sulfonate/bicarbonate transport system substrate-binding protein